MDAPANGLRQVILFDAIFPLATPTTVIAICCNLRIRHFLLWGNRRGGARHPEGEGDNGNKFAHTASQNPQAYQVQLDAGGQSF